MFLNYTPHDINILDKDNQVIEVIPSRGVIRVSQKREFVCLLRGIPLYESTYGEIEYPSGFSLNNQGIDWVDMEEESDIIIVSRMVKEAILKQENKSYSDRFVVPDDIVRDDKGNIIGCKGFSA